MNMPSTQRLTLRPPHSQNFPTCRDFLALDAAAPAGGRCSATESGTRFAAMAGDGTRSGAGWFTITDRDGSIGVAGIGHPPAHTETELGWMVHPSTWRHGYAVEAASAARDWASATLSPVRLFSYIDPANAASQGVARRLGATTDGTRVMREPDFGTWTHESAA